ncbi:MAG: mandelate racemase/muconate lactonizing enzyme family protein [Bacteroidota bacterium]
MDYSAQFKYPISRRNFVKTTGLASLALPGNFIQAQNLDKPEAGPTISQISVFSGSGSFYRYIGPNSYDDKPKGIQGHTRRTVLVELSDGTKGLGTVGYRAFNQEALKQVRNLLGKDIFSLYQWKDELIVGVSSMAERYIYNTLYSWVESALLDALGKVKQVPVYKLFGESIKQGIDPYDGTLYFAEIAQKRSVELIAQIGKRIKKDGYQAIKMKVGRPDKWLPGEAGVQRDIDAFIALREAVGTNFSIMTDANNGYKNQMEWALKFLKACAPYNMYFMEELIPDDTEQYLRIREELHKENLHIPIADGESIWDTDMMEIFQSYCESGVYAYIQPDIPTCGFTNILRIARMAEQYPHVKLIPHVWQSQMGLLMSAHVAKIQKNIPLIEDSRYNEHVMLAPGYSFDQGQWFVPEEPGWGVYLVPGYEEFLEGDPVILK